MEEVETKMKEEPEGEMIAGLSWEALRPQVRPLPLPKLVPSLFKYIWTAAPCCGHLYLKLFGC